MLKPMPTQVPPAETYEPVGGLSTANSNNFCWLRPKPETGYN